MKLKNILVATALVLPALVQAQSIFNTAPRASTPAAAPQRQAAAPQPISPAAPAVQQYQPTTPPAASAIPALTADPKILAQFDRYPNESDEAFIARMKIVYQRASADMERTTRAHLDKMRALSVGK